MDGLGVDPPVRELERAYGAKWRVTGTEAKFFSRRRHIYNAYDNLVRNGMSRQDASDWLHMKMGLPDVGSLAKLNQFLKNNPVAVTARQGPADAQP